MNSFTLVALALACFAALTEAYVGSGYAGGYHGGLYGPGYGTGPATAVCDTCQCVKTVVRPVVEQIPYTCSRRVRTPRLRSTAVISSPAVSVYSGPALYESGSGFMEPATSIVETRPSYIRNRDYAVAYGNNIVA